MIKDKLIVLFSILLWIFIGTACSNESSNNGGLTPYINIESSDITFYISSHTTNPTQYLAINLNNVESNASYELKYNSNILGSATYHLCNTTQIESSCVGEIALTSLLVYNVGDTFAILQNGYLASNFESANLLMQAIVQGSSGNTAWLDYKCGLTSINQLPPSPRFCNISGNNFTPTISDGCSSVDNTDIINTTAAIYWPNKFSDGKYGITCTGIPIAESWVITAGHCLGVNGNFYENGVKVYVSPGATQLPIEIPESQIATTSNVYLVESIYLLRVQGQNEYCDNKCVVYGDIALLHMKDYNFINVTPLVSSTESIVEPSISTIAGYGMHNESDIIGIIRNGKLNYRDAYYLYESDGIVYSAGTIPDSATNDYAWKFTGYGDSGGPILINKNGQFYLLGTLTGGTYLDGYSGVNCMYPGGQNEYASMRYWESTITGIINGTAESTIYNVTD